MPQLIPVLNGDGKFEKTVNLDIARCVWESGNYYQYADNGAIEHVYCLYRFRDASYVWCDTADLHSGPQTTGKAISAAEAVERLCGMVEQPSEELLRDAHGSGGTNETNGAPASQNAKDQPQPENCYHSFWELGQRATIALDDLLCAVSDLIDHDFERVCLDEETLSKVGSAALGLEECCPSADDGRTLFEELWESWVRPPVGTDAFVEAVSAIQALARSLVLEIGLSRADSFAYWQQSFKRLLVCADMLREGITALEALPELKQLVYAKARQKVQELQARRAESAVDEPPHSGDIATIPDGTEIGIAEPLRNVPDEMLEDILASEQAEPATHAPPKDATGGGATTNVVAAVEPKCQRREAVCQPPDELAKDASNERSASDHATPRASKAATFVDDLEQLRRVVVAMTKEIGKWRALVDPHRPPNNVSSLNVLLDPEWKWEGPDKFLIEDVVKRHNELWATWRQLSPNLLPAVRAAHAPNLVEWVYCGRIWDGTAEPHQSPGVSSFRSYTDAIGVATEHRHAMLSWLTGGAGAKANSSCETSKDRGFEIDFPTLDVRAVIDGKDAWLKAPLWKSYDEMDLEWLKLLVEQEYLAVRQKGLHRSAPTAALSKVEAAPTAINAPATEEGLAAVEPLAASESLKASYRAPDNYWRNVWLYERRKNGEKNATILASLRARAQEFATLESGNALRNAIESIAIHHGWPLLKGKAGRPKASDEA